MPQELIIDVNTLEEFRNILQTRNPGIIIVKFEADWCGPCKKIAPAFESGILQMPATVQPIILDVDEAFEVYAYMKNKKRIAGIPAFLCYYKNATDIVNLIPNDMCSGSDINELNLFFERCFNYSSGFR